MPQITPDSLMTLEAYARARPQFRARVMAHKKNRTLQLGGHVTLMFEDELTIRYQIQEMLRAERVFEEAGVQGELDGYNPLIPDGANWKATLMIEYPDVDERHRMLARLIGIEDRIWVQVEGQARVYAVADEDLELRLGLRHPRIRRGDETRADRAGTHGVERRSQGCQSRARRPREVGDDDVTPAIERRRHHARHLLLEVRRARAGEVDGVDAARVRVAEAHRTGLDGERERVLVRSRDGPRSRGSLAPGLPDQRAIETAPRKVRAKTRDSDHAARHLSQRAAPVPAHGGRW